MKINFRKVEQFNLKFKFQIKLFVCFFFHCLNCCSSCSQIFLNRCRRQKVANGRNAQLAYFGESWMLLWRISSCRIVQLCNRLAEFAWIFFPTAGRQSCGDVARSSQVSKFWFNCSPIRQSAAATEWHRSFFFITQTLPTLFYDCEIKQKISQLHTICRYCRIFFFLHEREDTSTRGVCASLTH